MDSTLGVEIFDASRDTSDVLASSRFRVKSSLLSFSPLNVVSSVDAIRAETSFFAKSGIGDASECVSETMRVESAWWGELDDWSYADGVGVARYPDSSTYVGVCGRVADSRVGVTSTLLSLVGIEAGNTPDLSTGIVSTRFTSRGTCIDGGSVIFTYDMGSSRTGLSVVVVVVCRAV